jgi:riboflavin kinase/FMN adenylyltransferase
VAEAELIETADAMHSNSMAAIQNPEILPGMMSIGVRPTIDGKNRTIEMNIFDFNADIYGRDIKIFMCQYLRPELKFDSLEDLKDQIDKDKANSLRYFSQQP